jgi:hypothetical protein
MERLDTRFLLSAISDFLLPPTEGLTAYLTAHASATPGEIDVRLGSPSADPVATLTPDPNTNSVRIHALAPSQTLVDQVAAVDKPTGGVVFTGFGESALEINAGEFDRQIDASDIGLDNSITLIDTTHARSSTTYASAVNLITIRSNDDQATDPASATTVNVSGFRTWPLRVHTGASMYDTVNVTRSTAAEVNTGAGHNTVNVTTFTVKVDFSGAASDGPGAGNRLSIGDRGTVLLRSLVGGDTAGVIDDLEIFGNLIIEAPATFGTIDLKGSAASVSGRSATTIQTLNIEPEAHASFVRPTSIGTFNLHGTAVFTASSTPSVTTFGSSTGSVELNAATELTVLTPGRLGALSVLAGTVHFMTSHDIGRLTVSYSSLVELAPRAAAPVSSGPRVLYVNELDLVMHDNRPSRVDLHDNALIVDYTGPSPYGEIKSQITSGYNNRTWTGLGIASSTAAEVMADSGNSHKTALGYAESADLSFTTIGGRAFDTTSVIVRYTLEGDANLDTQVNAADLGALASNWQSTSDWRGGDLDFNGTTDVNDLGILASNWMAVLELQPLFRARQRIR